MEEFLPLLILILIVRGIYGSRKRKEKYTQERSNMNQMPSQNEKAPNPNSLKGLIYELTREMSPQNMVGQEKDLAREAAQKTNQKINTYDKFQTENKNNMNKKLYQESQIRQEEIEKEKIMYNLKAEKTKKALKNKKPKNVSLEFSKNPLVQGIIFSEILGPPKSKR